MIGGIITAVIRHRLVVSILVAAAVVLSGYGLRTAALDAIPDISDPQILVYTKWPRSPQLLETEVTEPLIRALSGAPDVEAIRGTSHMGYSFVSVVLRDPGRRAEVRAFVLDRITAIRSELPPDASVTLGPDGTSMGWIYQYALVDREQLRDLRELRLLNEGQIKPALQSVPGIAEVASVGGLEKQYQLKLFPPLLANAGLSLRDIIATLQALFQEVGGRTIEVTGREYQLRGAAGTASLDQLEIVVVGRDRAGRPVRLRDVGYVQVGYDLRRGIADLDGTGEVVGGIIVMQQTQNVLSVTRALEEKLTEIRARLPQGLDIVTTYDRSALIWDTLGNFSRALGYELLVVTMVIGVALRSARAAAAPIAVLLLGTLFSFLPLVALGHTINLFSLAGLAIAIGEMADATIVIVENGTAELSKRAGLRAQERRDAIIGATARMTRPLLFSMLIILTSFLPIFFLGEREGRLFNPLAYGKTFAMAFSTLLTLFVLPIIIIWIFKRADPASEEPRENAFVRSYRGALHTAIRFRYGFVAGSIVLLVASGALLASFQKDYMPEMEEGSILYMPTTLPGLPAREAGWILQQMDRKLKEFPEVARVFGKLGRADSATDPAPVSMIETTVMLHPRSMWRDGMTNNTLVSEMNQAMQIVGYVNSWTQPIATRVMMLETGIQTSVGLKVKGRDLAGIAELSTRVEEILRDVPGTQSVLAERIASGYFVDVQLDLERMAARGVMVDEAMPTVRYAIGGDNVVMVREPDNTRVPLAVQYSPEYVDTLEKVRATPVVTGDGRAIPLSDIANVAVRNVPEMIRNDNGDLAAYVYVYVQGVTAPEYVDRARDVLARGLNPPAGYSVEWTGLYVYAEDARARLVWVVPLALAIMFGLLLMFFRSVTDSALIMLSAPFALVGGVFLQWMLGHSMTTAVVIGYVSLFAVAIQTGIIMIEFIREALARRPETQPYIGAVIDGSVARLRPKLMTVATTVLGLLPIMFATGSGMDITKPLAAPTFGGMISSTIYVLFLIPCLFAIGHDLRGVQWLRMRRAAHVAGLAVIGVMCLATGACGGRPESSPASTTNAAPPLNTVRADSGGSVEVTYRSEPDPPETGDNVLEVTVKQPDGTPVTDAAVTATFSMPAMPSMNMPAMRTDATLAHAGDGSYRGTSQLAMGGTWNVTVSVARAGEQVAVKRFSIVAK